MKNIVTVIFILLFIPFCFADRFEDFADTYDYSYDAEMIKINNFQLSECASNCTGIRITINITAQPKTYTFHTAFADKSASLQKHFFDETGIIELVFYPPFTEQQAIVWLKAFDEKGLVYYGNITAINISEYGFVMQNKTLDEDTSEEIIFINDSLENGNLIVFVNISDKTNQSFFLFDEFSQYIAQAEFSDSKVVFDGESINASGLNGQYLVKTSFLGQIYEYTTNYYDYGEFAKKESPIVYGDVKNSDSTKKENPVIGFVKEIFSPDEQENKTTSPKEKDEKINVKLPDLSNDKKTLPDFDLFQKTKISNFLTGNAVSNGENEIFYPLMFLVTLLIVLGLSISAFIFFRKK